MISLKKSILSFFRSNFVYERLILILSLIILFSFGVFNFRRHKLPDRYLILGKGTSTRDSVIHYVSRYNKDISKQMLKYIIDTYIWESSCEGVNHDFAIGQMLHETNLLKFGGEVKKSQNNFSVLGTMESFLGKAYFNSVCRGIRAHVQHMKSYASRSKLRKRCVDLRYDIIRHGSVKNVYGFNESWSLDIVFERALISKIDGILGESREN